jgi:hypothetical protein
LIHSGLLLAFLNGQAQAEQALLEFANMEVQFTQQQKHPKVRLLHQELFQLVCFFSWVVIALIPW